MEKCYTVAETVKITGVKSYVLRYWEDELELHIGRTNLGHRYYTGYDIQLFLNIKELKNRGLQLKAIRDLLPKISGCEADVRDTAEHQILEQKLSDEKVSLLEEKLSEKKEKDVEKEKESEKEETGDDKILEFQEILERLIAQELHAKKEGEDRWRSLDAAIRRQQLARKEAAAASDKKTKKNIKAHK